MNSSNERVLFWSVSTEDAGVTVYGLNLGSNDEFTLPKGHKL